MDEVGNTILAAMTSWHQGKLLIEHSVAVSNDALHIVIGVAVWLVLALATRRPLSSLAPWLGLAGLILWNEAVDLHVEEWPDRFQQYGEGAKDLVLTMLIPTVLLVLVRYRSSLFRPGRLNKRRS